MRRPRGRGKAYLRDDESAPASVASDLRSGRPIAIAMSPRYGVDRFMENDGPFIADARDSVPKLCAMLRTATEALQAIQKSRVKVRFAPTPVIFVLDQVRDEADRALARLDEMATEGRKK